MGKILSSREALQGERKQVTVLLADLKGSTEILADRDPEEARKLLDPVLEHMMEAVHRYEGTVNQVMGDGIMALFGAPLAHEDHAVRACYAALRMQESVKRYADGVFRSHGVPIQIRVGLNSGEVVVRAIGSDLHMDYTAVGQTTHLAARMEQMAQPGTILIASETLTLAEGFVQVAARGPVPVKGLAEPVEVFELTAASPVRSRLHAMAARGLTRFVGRDRELDVLTDALARAGEGHGQVVAIVGEPGVGKSRLVWEFTHSHRSQGWLVLEGASVSYGRATTYFPVVELLRGYFGLEPRDDSRRIREKVTGKLLSLDRALEPTLPSLLSLLDVAVEDPGWARLDPSQRRRHTLDALKRVVLRESQVQPVLLVVEDLHWIDSETQAWLDLLVESLPTASLLLLVNYRPEYRHGWGSKTYYQQIRLDSLPARSAGNLLDGLLGNDPGLADLARLLIERTQGNPFFLEESVRTLIEARALHGERGAYRLAGPIQSLQLPATAQGILAARIDRLSPDDKRVLQTAAVIGKDVPLPVLRAVADEPEDNLLASLGRLQAAEFVYEARLFPETEYTFKHALTHEVAYAGLLHERRRDLHRRTLLALKAYVAAGDGNDAVERLAHHAEHAEAWEEAVTYARQSAQKAAGRSAFREASRHAEQAVRAIDRLPENAARMVLAIDTRLLLRGPLWQIGRYDDVLRILREAESLAQGLDDARRLAWVRVWLFNLFWLTGRWAEVPGLLAEVGRAMNFEDDLALSMAAANQYAQACWNSGQLTLMRDVLEQRLAVADAMPAVRTPTGLSGAGVAVTFRALLSGASGELGDFERAEQYGEEARTLAASSGFPFLVLYAASWQAFTLLLRGDFARASDLMAPMPALAHEYELTVTLPGAYVILGVAQVGMGQVDRGLQAAEQGLELTRRSRVQMYEAAWVLMIAEACLRAGRIERAATLADQGLEIARQRRELGYEARLLHIRAGVLAARGADPARAEACWREAKARATELGMRTLLPHCDLGLGGLCRTAGRLDEARQHYVTAVSLLDEMGMRYWLPEAQAALREVSG
jgi:class 3 adenylate cyclase/tetratricopeptide (TPR) repeat protein